MKKIYFVVSNDNGNCDRARRVFDEYQTVFQKEHRAVYSKVGQSQKEALKEVNLYDEQRGYFAIAKLTRQLLIILRYFFSLWTLLKDRFGKWDWVVRRQVIEMVAFFKTIVPVLCILLMYKTECTSFANVVLIGILLYDLGDTVTYLIALMFLADVQRPSANVIRSLVMLVINYIEVEMDIAAIYLLANNFTARKMHAVKCAINFIIDPLKTTNIEWMNYVNNGLKFFFLTVALSYFSNHMRMRKFRTV